MRTISKLKATRTEGTAMVRTLLIMAFFTLTACGGSDETFQGVGTSGGESETVDIEVSESNRNVDVRSSQKVGTVTVSGSNNSVSFSSIPESIVVTGDDNTIYKPSSSSYTDRGDGNVLVETGG